MIQRRHCRFESNTATSNVLSDAKFLREHCIRYCQHLRRDATARAQAFIGSAGELPVKTTKKRLNTKKPKKSGTNLVDTKTTGNSNDDNYMRMSLVVPTLAML